MVDQNLPTAEPARDADPQSARFAIFDRRVSRRDVLRVMGLGAVSGVIAACTSTVATPAPTAPPTAAPATPAPTAPPTPAPTAPPTAAPTAAPSVAPTAAPTSAAPVATPKPRGGTIRAGTFEGGLIAGWLPWTSFGQEPYWNWCAQRLMSVAPDGTIVYELAKSSSLSADGKVYTFTLLPNAVWHDGTPVTAADVVFTYNTTLKAKAGSNSITIVNGPTGNLFQGTQAVVDDNTKDASGIVAVDDHTVTFTADAPNAQNLSSAGPFATIRIAPKHLFEGIALEDYPKQPVATDLYVGTGPYKMTEAKFKQFCNMDAYDKYVNGAGWTGLPAADKVSLKVYDDPDAQLTSTVSGEVDFQYFRKPSGDNLKQLQAIKGMSAQKSLVGFNIFFSFNLKKPSVPALLDKRVRQAFVWSLDRHTLVDDVLGGVFKVPDIMNHWIAPWANSDKLEKYDPQDVDKAKKLLAAGGWDPAAVVDVHHYPPKLDPDVPVIVEMWKAAGINSKLTPFSEAGFVHEFYESKGKAGAPDEGPSYDVGFVYGFGTLDGSPWGSDGTLGSKAVYPNGYNSMRWVSAEWDKEFATALLQPDQATQAPHFKRCSELFNDELPYIPIYQRVDYAIVSDNLRGPEQATILHPGAGGVHYWEWYIHA